MEIKYYKKEFTNIKSNKFSSVQTTSLYYGLLFQFVSDRDIFNKNIDIEVFINTVFNKKYKEYVYNARPYLISRLLSDLQIEYDFQKTVKSLNEILKYVENHKLYSDNEIKNKENKSSNSINKNVIDWFKQVSNENED